jgi:Flp pilus assembly protein TadD
LLRQGKSTEAEREYLAAIALTPSVAPRVDLADLYRMLNRETDAERVLREAIAADPQAAAPQHALGLALIRQKRYDEGFAALKRAVELAPEQARYAYVYAAALQSTGHTGEAKIILEHALAASPSDVDVLGALLQAALQAEDYARALPYAERLHILVPDDPSIESLVERLRQATGSPSPR